ncbi:hypothetical protein SAMN04488691_11627 [Haloferax larsenii]|uniref:Uncharacterized protein n=1 Tax=Haloferax larsenii TaxID=302484 RepID=A0A1H7V349_HALLR|nr:hypothetical protein SAMN04488691_11627 [Haloferax larsenii]
MNLTAECTCGSLGARVNETNQSVRKPCTSTETSHGWLTNSVEHAGEIRETSVVFRHLEFVEDLPEGKRRVDTHDGEGNKEV